MFILGDIGNSETKIFLVNQEGKIIKKTNLSSRGTTKLILHKKFKILTNDFKNIKKILFCSVVPKNFKLIKKFISKKTKIKCYEIKELNLTKIPDSVIEGTKKYKFGNLAGLHINAEIADNLTSITTNKSNIALKTSYST